MVMRDRSNLLKNLLVMGAAGASLLVSLPALSQTSGSQSSGTTAPQEVEMSAEGMKILCEVFPLNSRCQGGEQPTAIPSTPAPRESTPPPTSLEPQTNPSLSPEPSAPGEITTPSVEPSAPEPSGSTSPGEKPQNLPAPGTTPPDTTSPSENPSTAPGYPPSKSLSTAPKGEADRLRTEAPASAQTPAAPSATPASPQSPSAAPTTETPAAAVSPDELQKFAKVIPQLQEIQKTAQQQVSEAIKKAGLTEDRFRELYGAQQSPPVAQPGTPATPQEQQSVQQVVAQLETIKTEVQTRREQAVQSQGLALTRFNEILTAVRQDSSLQEQLQRMLTN